MFGLVVVLYHLLENGMVQCVIKIGQEYSVNMQDLIMMYKSKQA
jgi:hypothetical protein